MRPTLIAGLDAVALTLPLTEPFAIATATQAVAANVLVRVTLADGTVGLGEAAPFAASRETQGGAMAAVAALRADLVGEDAAAWRGISGKLAEACPDLPATRCGIETAVLDAWLRHHNVAMAPFFGGARQQVRIDMTVTAGDEAHAAASARAIVARGIQTIKIKIGALSPEEDLKRLVAIHAAAPSAALYVDANGGYDEAQARAFAAGARAAGIELLLFEQPVPRADPDALAALARDLTVAVCADESAQSAEDVQQLARRAIPFVNIKIMKCGPVEAAAMWQVARSAGMRLMMGGMVESILAMTAGACMAAGLGGFDVCDLDTHLFIAHHPLRGGFTQRADILAVDGITAGHGVTVDGGLFESSS